jgi:hypothetical protein
MNIRKAPVLLKKAVTMCKSKTGVLAASLLIVTSLRRKMAMVGAISHKIDALMVAADQAKARDRRRALMLHKAKKTPAILGSEIVDLSHQLALFDQEENGDASCHDWTLHPSFDDDDSCCNSEEYEENDNHEPAATDLTRSNRQVEGLEFNMDYDVDQAAEMFISRFREQMNRSL